MLRKTTMMFAAVLMCITPMAFADAQGEKEALAEFMKSDVVQKFKGKSYGYAVFPTIGKGGFGIGGAHGKGGVYRGNTRTGDSSMTQVSIGLQLGGQAYRQLILFEDKRAFDDFTSGNFEFSAQAEAIAITSSAGAAAGTEGSSASADSEQRATGFHKGMIVFTQGKGGLMYQATLGGQKYNYKAK